MRSRWVPVAFAAALATVACSKENKVTARSDDRSLDSLGEACNAAEAGNPCGGGICIAGRCRQKCQNDAECDEDLCFGEPTGSQGGCRLADEASCDTEPCSTALLLCAIDQSCRIPCNERSPCPRNDQTCVRGACFGELEAGDKPWTKCNTGEFRCGANGDLEQCNEVSVGWGVVDECASEALCDAQEGTCAAPLCDPKESTCDGRIMRYCPPSRDRATETSECDSEALCLAGLKEGACQTSCDTSQERCDGAAMVVCKRDLTGLKAPVLCVSRALCLEGLSTGECGDPVCDPDSVFCNGAALRQCDAGGTGSSLLGRCATPGLCSQAVSQGSRSCPSPFCLVGETRCDEVDSELCVDDGSSAIRC